MIAGSQVWHDLLLARALRKLHYIAAKLYDGLKYPPLIIRDNTSDKTVCASIFVDKELKYRHENAEKVMLVRKR